MSKEQFTPSPWFRKGKRVYWKKPEKDLPHGTLPNGQICLCKSAEDWPECEEEARANAQLISTAPEMYELLSEILEFEPKGIRLNFFDRINPKIESVLRKARGESEVNHG